MPKKVSTGGVTSKPSTDNKTGNWRTFRPVVTEKCTGCAICRDYCPDSCIVIDKKAKVKAIINYDYCKGCLICANVCPVKAITSEKER